MRIGHDRYLGVGQGANLGWPTLQDPAGRRGSGRQHQRLPTSFGMPTAAEPTTNQNSHNKWTDKTGPASSNS